MTVRPLHDYVMIRRIPDVKVGLIHIPDNYETKPRIGIVEAVGPGRVGKGGARIPMSVAVGDRVRFDAGAKGYMVPIYGGRRDEARLLIPESGIEAVLSPDGEAHALGSPWPGHIAEGVSGGE